MTKQSRIKSLNEALKVLSQSNVTKFAVFYKRDGMDGKVQVYIEDDLECELIQKSFSHQPKIYRSLRKVTKWFRVVGRCNIRLVNATSKRASLKSWLFCVIIKRDN